MENSVGGLLILPSYNECGPAGHGSKLGGGHALSDGRSTRIPSPGATRSD